MHGFTNSSQKVNDFFIYFKEKLDTMHEKEILQLSLSFIFALLSIHLVEWSLKIIQWLALRLLCFESRACRGMVMPGVTA